MDQEFENSQVLEKAFEDEVTGELPDTAEVTEQLKTVLAATSELNEIEQGVRQEGVSQEDIEQVFTIIKRLNEAGIECGVTPSMEEYGLGHYTKTRSIVNHSLGLESIGGTIINVIKIVIEKLIAFVASIVKSYRIFTNNDRIVNSTFETARKKSKDVQEFILLLKRISMTPTTEIDNQVLEFAKSELVNNRKIPRSGVGLAALFDPTQITIIQGMEKNAQSATRSLRRMVRDINRLASGYMIAVEADVSAFSVLQGVRIMVDQLKTEDPDPEFLAKRVGVDILLDNTIRKKMEPLTQNEYLMKAFYDIASELRDLKKYKPDSKDPDFNNTMTMLLEKTLLAFEDLDLIVRFFTYVKKVQLQVCSLQLRILNRHASLLYQHVLETTPHELTRVKAEQAFDKLGKKLRTYGI